MPNLVVSLLSRPFDILNFNQLRFFAAHIAAFSLAALLKKVAHFLERLYLKKLKLKKFSEVFSAWSLACKCT